MNTITEYIKYYGDHPFKEIPFNDIDNVLFVTLAYLPLEMINYKDTIPLTEIAKKLKPLELPPHTMIYKSRELLNKIKNTKRYKNIKIENFINKLNKETQFSAITIRYEKNNCFVSYRGTDNSLIGWKEDFELSYTYPVKAQTYAKEYLENTIKETDEKIYIGGHSKGGNLAITSAIGIKEEIQNRIITIYNNDGPGFLEEQIKNKNLQKISPKIKTFIPEESIVGLLLTSPVAYYPIKSTKKGIAQHDPTSWECFGQFLKEGITASLALKFQDKICAFLKETTKETRKNLTEAFFKIIKESGVTHFRDLKTIKFDKITAMIKEANNIDDATKKLLLDTLKITLESEKKQ